MSDERASLTGPDPYAMASGGVMAGGAASAGVAAAGEGLAAPRDYFELLKPRVMSLVIFTALVGLVRAPGDVHPVIAFTALLCIAVGAGASGALNMWWDADIDAVMTRTRGRPVPSGRVTGHEALAFGLTLSAFSVVVLGLLVNALAGVLLAFTIFFYVVIYTMWLKRSTSQNIVIGGAAGAFPPLVAWAAASGTVSLEPVLLFAIIFFWTPPHFWALALYRADDYARAGVPMLPVTAGPDETRLQILLYTLFLVPLAASPAFLGYAGLAYGAVSVLAGAWMIVLAVRVFRVRQGEAAVKAAKGLFGFSIVYLFALFATLLGEAVIGGLLR
ncbi:heme o synthase [Xanthobacter aminoxidans]